MRIVKNKLKKKVVHTIGEPLHSIVTVADILGVHRHTVKSWIESGKLQDTSARSIYEFAINVKPPKE